MRFEEEIHGKENFWMCCLRSSIALGNHSWAASLMFAARTKGRDLAKAGKAAVGGGVWKETGCWGKRLPEPYVYPGQSQRFLVSD